MKYNFQIAPIAVGIALTVASATTSAQIVHTGGVSIDGSLCIGFDCVASESFGFDTLRLKENNLRIHFDDTSTTASFPPNDWRIVINDSSNGGASYFAVEDATASRIPFRVVAGAPANSLYVDAQGDVGMGTSTPAVEAHIADGNTPTLRLEQNGSSGFAPQTWDVAGNEAGFFIRDATSGSTLPFRILPGAASQSLVVAGSDNVGIGTLSPSDKLHVYQASSAARIKLTRNDKSSTATEEADWILNSNGTFRISGGADAAELTLDASGNLKVTGGYFVNATLLNVPDYVFEPGYPLKSIEEQASYIAENKHLPSVGAAPSKNAGANLDLVEQQLGMLEELEKAHLYIVHLNQELKRLQQEKAEQVATLEQRLAKLERTSD